MKKLLPQDFDLTDFDKEQMKKQLDLTVVEVTLSRDPEREAEPDHPIGTPYYKRAVIKYTNEEGMFKRLQEELAQIGQEYGVAEDTINDMFMEVSCSKSKLIETLKG